MDKQKAFSLTYSLLLTALALTVLVVLALNEQLHWSYTLTFLTIACVLSEWLVIRLPRGNSLTMSIIFVLLALVFRFEETTPWTQAVGALQVIAIGSLIGYGVGRRPPLLHLALYVAHYVLAASVAGYAFTLVSGNLPSWFISSFHLPAVTAYTVVFALLSMLLISPFNRRIIKGHKLPTVDLLYAIVLAPIALTVYYFFESRQLGLGALLLLALPLLGVLFTFRLYVTIDTTHSEVTQLYRISQEFVSAMSEEQTSQKVAQNIALAVSRLIAQVDACVIYAYHEEANEYVLIDTTSSEQQGPQIIMPGHGLLGRVVFDGAGTVINDVTLADALSLGERQWSPKTALIAHPLYAAQRQVGLLVLVRQGKGFTAEEFRLVGIVANQAGITLHNARLYEQSRQMAERDRQLDILNQTGFTQQSQRILARVRMDNQQAALLLGDIDDFRKVNNTYGHQTGDIVLANVANLMKEVVGGSGIVGRWGGEEFVVLLPNVSERQAMETAEEIRRRVEQSVFTSDEGQDVHATISTGVAIFPRDGGDFPWLHKQADRAAYLAKRMGKNRVCLYEDRKESIEASSASEPTMLQAMVRE